MLENGEGLLTVGQVSEAIGVSPGTVRLWESQGLVSPRRDRRGTRRYSDRELQTLRRIRYLRTVERLNIAAIRQKLHQTQATRAQESDHYARAQQQSSVGAALRATRRSRGMTLNEAGVHSGLSASFISALERGVTGASPTALTRLRAAYSEGHGTVRSKRAGDTALGISWRRGRSRRVVPVSTGVGVEWLSQLPGMMEPQLYTVEPGASSAGAYQHAGEEFLYVLDGMLQIRVGGTTVQLGRHEAVHFSSALVHDWSNPGRIPTRVLWITTERGEWAIRRAGTDGEPSEQGASKSHDRSGK